MGRFLLCINNRFVILVLVALSCVNFVVSDVVDAEGLGTPNYGYASSTGCLAWINWSNQPPPTGTWSNGHVVSPLCEYGPTIAVRGWNHTSSNSQQTTIDSVPLSQTEDLKERVRETLRNVKRIARNYGANYDDFAKCEFKVFNITVMRPIVNAVQAESEFWGLQTDWRVPVYPNRSIMGDQTFNGLDCLKTGTGVVYKGGIGPGGQVVCQPGDRDIGDVVELTVDFVHRRGESPQFPRNQ